MLFRRLPLLLGALLLHPIAAAAALPTASTTSSSSSLMRFYHQENCAAAWGDFPTVDSSLILSTSEKMIQNPSLAKDGACKCSMIYSLAVAAATKALQEDQAAASLAAARPQNQDKALAASSTYNRAQIVTAKTSTTKKSSSSNATRTAPTVIANKFPPSSCVDGMTSSGFPCSNVDLVDHLSLSLRDENGTDSVIPGNDVWGWTDPDTQREFVLWGVLNGHWFVEIVDQRLAPLGFLPTTNGTYGVFFHDAKVVNGVAYLGADEKNHGLQVLDLRQLLDLQECELVEDCPILEADALYRGSEEYPIVKSHNVVANLDAANKNDRNIVYLAGGSKKTGCLAGLLAIDTSDPLNLQTVGCFADSQLPYVHDAACVTYHGPDDRYQGREICATFNTQVVFVVDATDPSDMVVLSRTNYTQTEYTHQGWFSTDHSHVVFGDEYDELFNATMGNMTRTLILDVSNLTNPTNLQEYYRQDGNQAIDHNQYIINANAPGQEYGPLYQTTDLIYQANYRAGLRILQVLDYGSAILQEIGYFDTYPQDDATEFAGAWSSYPFFESGLVVVSNVDEGLFLVQPKLKNALIKPDQDEDEACVDSKTWKGLLGNPKKNCEWLSKIHSRKRRRKLCKRRAFKNRNKRVFFYCKATCRALGIRRACPNILNKNELQSA